MSTTIDWSKLTAPVPQEDLEYLPKAGKQLAYMTAQFVRRRLDAVVLGRWSYEVKPIPFSEGTPPVADGEPFAVVGTISVYDGDESVIRSSIGSGKNYKEAETDAFKRAAQRLGIGNELYEMGPGQVDPITQRIPKATPAARAEAAMAAAETVRAESKPAAPKSAPAADELACPKCAGRMWDNRENKKNPRSPDWKCRDKSCDGLYWKDADGRKAPEPTYASVSAAMEDEDSKLPF